MAEAEAGQPTVPLGADFCPSTDPMPVSIDSKIQNREIKAAFGGGGRRIIGIAGAFPVSLWGMGLTRVVGLFIGREN